MLLLSHFASITERYFQQRAAKRRNRLPVARLLAEPLENRIVLHTVLDMTHVHLEPLFRDGIWGLQANDTVGGQIYDASDVLLKANELTRTTQPAGWDFIGAGDGQTYWRLPQIVDPNVLTVAFDPIHLVPGTFDQYQPDDPRIGRAAEWVKVSLIDFSGPDKGNFSVWQSNQPLMDPMQWWISTADAGQTYDSALYLDVSADHQHYNFGLTAVGIYTVTFQISALQGGKVVPSDPIPVCFGVEVDEGCEGNRPSSHPRIDAAAAPSLSPSILQRIALLPVSETVPMAANGPVAAGMPTTLNVPAVDQAFAAINTEPPRPVPSGASHRGAVEQPTAWLGDAREGLGEVLGPNTNLVV